MIVEIMPQLVKEAAAPLGNIDKISVVDTGSGEGGGANRVTNYATNLLSTTQETLKETLGLDVKSLIENFAGSNTSEPPKNRKLLFVFIASKATRRTAVFSYSLLLCLLSDLFDIVCRYTSHDRAFSDIFGHHCPSSNDRMVTDGHTGNDRCI